MACRLSPWMTTFRVVSPSTLSFDRGRTLAVVGCDASCRAWAMPAHEKT